MSADAPIRNVSYMEGLILAAYEWWSENTYSATFMEPDRPTVKAFIRNMCARKIWEQYEVDLLDIYAEVIREGVPQ